MHVLRTGASFLLVFSILRHTLAAINSTTESLLPPPFHMDNMVATDRFCTTSCIFVDASTRAAHNSQIYRRHYYYLPVFFSLIRPLFFPLLFILCILRLICSIFLALCLPPQQFSFSISAYFAGLRSGLSFRNPCLLRHFMKTMVRFVNALIYFVLTYQRLVKTSRTLLRQALVHPLRGLIFQILACHQRQRSAACPCHSFLTSYKIQGISVHLLRPSEPDLQTLL
jgi:hypothetical protein